MSTDFAPTDWATHDVHGGTLREAAERIAAMPEAGATENVPSYSLETDEHGQVTAVAITVATRVTLPNWTGYAQAHPGEQAEWDRFARALLEHEYGHLELINSHFGPVEEHMLGTPRHHAEAVFQQARHDLHAAEAAYDHQTDNGRATGTIIDVGVSPAPG